MESDLSKAQHYRDQALKMRALAETENNLEAKKALVSLSDTYDKLCQKALERAGHSPGANG